MTSTSENHIIARRYLGDLWSRGLLATVDSIVAPSCELRDPLCGLRRGRDAIKATVCELRLPVPDLTFSIDSFMVEAGDQLAVSWSARGTHRAPLLGIPATGCAFTLSGMLLLRCRASQLIAITMCWDPTHLLAQLGLYGADVVAAPVPRSRPEVQAAAVPAANATNAKSGRSRLAKGTAQPTRAKPEPPPESTWLAATQAESEVDAGWV